LNRIIDKTLHAASGLPEATDKKAPLGRSTAAKWQTMVASSS